MTFLDPSLLVAAGASFIAGVMGYIIVKMWIKPIVGYQLTKRRLADDLTRYEAHTQAPAADASRGGKTPSPGHGSLRDARRQAMKLVAYYNEEIPYWFRLFLDSRQESPAEAAGRLTHLTKLRNPQERLARIAAVRKDLRLRKTSAAAHR